MKRIGICIKDFDSIFTNGCAQQGYFVMKSLRKAGFKVDFVSIEEHLKEFEVIKEPVYNICNINVLEKYSTLIFSSLIVDQYVLLNQIKLLGIKIANLMVGNFYIINCEEFTFNVHNNVIKDMNNEYVDEIWLMPMYTHVKEYIECMTKKPVQIVPYVWDNEIIKEYINKKAINPYYNIINNTNPIDIILMEPNLSIHKTSLPILVFLNKYFLNYPERLGTIHLFGKPARNKNCLECIKHLDIVKCDKIILYERTLSLEIYHRLRLSNIKYVMVSNNIRNGLNFIHLECLTLNIPIIHNCKPYKQNGLFFEDSDANTQYNIAINHLNKVWNNTAKNDEIGSNEILEKYNPYAENNVKTYSKKLLELDNKSKGSIYDLNNIFSNIDNTYKINDEFNVVITINELCNLKVIEQNLLTMNNNSNKKYKVTLYITNNMYDKIKQLIYQNEYGKLIINLVKTDMIESKSIKLYALSQTFSKYVFYSDQNNIIYIPLDELERIIIKNNSFVGLKLNYELSKDDSDKTNDYLMSIFKTFGRVTSNKIIDGKFFLYVNTSPIIHYLKNAYNTPYAVLSDILLEEYLLGVIFTLIVNKMVFIDTENKIAVNMQEDKSYPIGYIVNCENATIFINIDTLLEKYVNLSNIIPMNYNSSIKTIIKNKIYRKIDYV